MSQGMAKKWEKKKKKTLLNIIKRRQLKGEMHVTDKTSKISFVIFRPHVMSDKATPGA